MRLCVPTDGEEGLDAHLSERFGRAPVFTLLDTLTGGVEAVPNPERSHGHGCCAVTARLGDWGVEAVACRSVGPNVLASLRALGIEVFVAVGPTVRDLLDQARSKELEPLSGAPWGPRLP